MANADDGDDGEDGGEMEDSDRAGVVSDTLSEETETFDDPRDGGEHKLPELGTASAKCEELDALWESPCAFLNMPSSDRFAPSLFVSPTSDCGCVDAPVPADLGLRDRPDDSRWNGEAGSMRKCGKDGRRRTLFSFSRRGSLYHLDALKHEMVSTASPLAKPSVGLGGILSRH